MPDSHFALEAVVRLDGYILARCLLRRGRYVIGHDRRNEINAYHDSVSGKHARLTVTSNDEFAIEDLGSANGTIVDGSAIDGVTPLTLDSTIQLGEVTLAFERGGLPASVFAHLPEGFLRTSRYAVGEPIVEGRTSIIYEARDTVLLRTVAMKVLRPAAQADPAQVLAFIREAQIAAQLPHGGILPVYDFGLDPEIGLYSATRFIEGESLADLLTGMASRDKGAPQATLYSLLQIFLKACSTVAFAHARGVVHSALRPEAIIFGRFGEVFVDHWGFAHLLPATGSDQPLVQAPERASAPALSRYTTPEQAEGAADIDPRTDVHALGAILFRILTLRNFNPGETEEELLDHALQPRLALAEALTAYALGGPCPERLAAACARALNPAREERFANAHELKKEISDWLESGGPSGEHTKIWKQLTGLLGRR
jgi:hypothetical protein